MLDNPNTRCFCLKKKYLCSMVKKISSIQNPIIKQLCALQEKSRERKKKGVFVVEGHREILLAIKAGYTMDTLFYCEEIFKDGVFPKNQNHPLATIEVSLEVYKKIAYRESTEGIIAIFQSKNHSLENIKFKSKNPLILIAEAPEKPGNMGALFRTADAAKLDCIIIANPQTDVYNPNVIRSSVGCLFTNQVAVGSSSEIINFLKQKNIAIYGAALQAAKIYSEIDFCKASAIVVGTESKGLTPEWLQNTTQNIYIPMEGAIDSLNVSVAAAIVIFEAKRQRNYK